MRVMTSTRHKSYGRHCSKYKVVVQPDFHNMMNISFWPIEDGIFPSARYKRNEVLLPFETARQLGLALVLATERPKKFVKRASIKWVVDEDAKKLG